MSISDHAPSLKVTALAIPDDEVPPYEIRYMKSHSTMQTSGDYPHNDEVHALVRSPAFEETWRADTNFGVDL